MALPMLTFRPRVPTCWPVAAPDWKDRVAKSRPRWSGTKSSRATARRVGASVWRFPSSPHSRQVSNRHPPQPTQAIRRAEAFPTWRPTPIRSPDSTSSWAANPKPLAGPAPSHRWWPGLIALINQQLPHPVGFINALLYQNSSAFRDITSGNNGAYKAGPGWDACTGLGSPDGKKLLQALQG